MISQRFEIALIIPTHNPEERILKRALAAIESLDRAGIASVECVLVDNNSKRRVAELDCVKGFLDRCKWAKVVTESRPGLVFARMAGFAATTAPVMIVFDDDNEPDVDYLQVVRECFEKFPSVAVWGPGNISVEFLEPVPEYFRREYGRIFNERHMRYPAYGCVPAAWEAYYPIGMGQVFRRAIAEKYVDGVENGTLRATGRSGSSMASGEDIQLVWEAVKMGFAAGIHPGMRVNHLIPRRRCSAAYIRRVVFGCAASYPPAFFESFPSERRHISVFGNRQVIMELCRLASRSVVRLRFRKMQVEIANYLGRVLGTARAAQCPIQRWMLGLAKLLKME
jgi:glycosyltransferase involved in cell wall biosynthesis